MHISNTTLRFIFVESSWIFSQTPSQVEALLSTKGKVASMMFSWFVPLSSVSSLSLSTTIALPFISKWLCSEVF